jgi:hypothetical protein
VISIVYDVKKYRRLLADAVEDGDVVIEIGPHVGKSTAAYVGCAKMAVAVDIGPQSEKALAKLGKEFPQLAFVRGDARSFSTMKQVLEMTKECDVLAVDLGGGRFPDTVFKVWAAWSGVFRPRDSVIRNRGLAEFLQKARIEDDSLRREFLDDGWLSSWGRGVPSKLKDQLDEFRMWVKVED